MRSYAKVSPELWIGSTGRELRGDPEAQALAAYLISCPNATMIGLYYLPVGTIAHELGWDTEGASKALRRVSEGGFCRYDFDSDIVWVVNMARWQILSDGKALNANDNRCAGARRLYEEIRNNVFLGEFFDMYEELLHLKNKRGFEGASKGLRRGFEAREQGAGSREKREESKSREKLLARSCDKHSSEPPVPAVIIIPLVGTGEHQVSQADVDEWTQAFPAVDVMQELRNIRQWCLANPKRRKTAVGAKRFIVQWLTKSQNQGGSRRPTGGASQQSTFRQVTEELMRDAYEYDRDHQEGICGPDVKAKGALPEPSH